MNESSFIKAKIELELAIVKELYKNKKIGMKEYVIFFHTNLFIFI